MKVSCRYFLKGVTAGSVIEPSPGNSETGAATGSNGIKGV